jgi:hypothetical protein
MHRSLPFVLTQILLAALLAGCSGGGHSPSEPSSPDTIAITSITPAAGTKLTPGSTVTFSANISYGLVSKSTGTVVLALEDQLSNPFPTSDQPTATVNQGTGSTTLASTFTIPATGITQMQVFVSLTPTGATLTSTVASVAYPVGT